MAKVVLPRISSARPSCNLQRGMGILANMRRSPNDGTMLGHRLQRWPNIVLALGERLVLAGMYRPAAAGLRYDTGP